MSPHDVVDLLAVDRHETVTVPEAHFVSRRVEIIAPFRVLVRKVGVAPGVANGAVDDDGQQDVHHDAGHHYQEPLPGGFGPEFVGFDRLFHLFLVHRFVDHAGDLDVAAQRQPAQTVLRVAPLELEERKPRVEEDVEFFDADLESPGHQEVPEFVFQFVFYVRYGGNPVLSLPVENIYCKNVLCR